MERLSAPERTREELRALMNGELGTAAARRRSMAGRRATRVMPEPPNDGAVCASRSSNSDRSPLSEKNSTTNIMLQSRRWPGQPSPEFPANPSLDPITGSKAGVVGGMSGSKTYVQTPTIHYVPVQGQQLIQQITTPITTDTLSSLYNSNCRSQIYCSLQPHE
jgi:hypothetical protein